MYTLQSVKKVNICEKGKFIHEIRDTHFHLIYDVIEALLVIVHFPTWVPILHLRQLSKNNSATIAIKGSKFSATTIYIDRYHFETSLQFA